MTGMDEVRRILDQLADDTKPPYGHLNADAYRHAIDQISRIAYPEVDE